MGRPKLANRLTSTEYVRRWRENNLERSKQLNRQSYFRNKVKIQNGRAAKRTLLREQKLCVDCGNPNDRHPKWRCPKLCKA